MGAEMAESNRIVTLAKGQTDILKSEVFRGDPAVMDTEPLARSFVFLNALRLSMGKREDALKAELKQRIAEDGAIDAKKHNMQRIAVDDFDVVNQAGKPKTTIKEEAVRQLLTDKLGDESAASRFEFKIVFETMGDVQEFLAAAERGIKGASKSAGQILEAAIRGADRREVFSQAKLQALVELGKLSDGEIEALREVVSTGTVSTKVGRKPAWAKEMREAVSG